MIRLIKKSISLLASAFVVLIVSGFISLHPISQYPAYAQGVPAVACEDLSMVAGHALTDPYMAGQLNAGQFDFNLPVNVAYQACSRNSNIEIGNPSITYNPIEGWAWNTNLGDISFYCKDGLNAGAACGAANQAGQFINYETRYILGANKKLDGFAWGDGTGWISLSCTDGFNNGVACGNQNYGVQVATVNNQVYRDAAGQVICGPMNKGDLYGYAYSDSLGYMNFCGAKVPWQPIYTAVVNPLDSAGAAIVDASGANVNANGVDNYKIKVQVLADGDPVRFGPGNGQITLELTDIVNTVKRDQVTCSQAGAPAQNCATDAISQTGFVWDDRTSSFINTVTSVAPTGVENVFSATGVRVTVKRADNVTVREMQKTLPGAPAPFVFNFLSLAEVDRVAALSGREILIENAIPAAPNDFQDISFTVTKRGTEAVRLADNAIEIHSQLYDCSPNYDFFFDQNGNKEVDANETPIPPVGPNDVGVFPTVVKSGICSVRPVPGQGLSSIYRTTAAVGRASFYTVLQEDGEPSLEETSAIALQTIISYSLPGGRTVRYFSKAIRDGSISNQIADIRGNIRLDVFDASGMPASDKVAESLGQRAQSRRTVFSKAIRSSLSGKSAKNPGANSVSIDTNNLGDTLNGADKILYYKRAAATPCTIVLGSNATVDLSFSQPSTIVAEGCDVFIDSNLLGDGVNARLGIIALEDLTLDSNTRRGGNIYVCGKVTDIEANVVVDNSIFSYGGANSTDCGGANKTPPAPAPQLINPATGYPDFGGSMREVLKNQLSIKGSIVGNNTYGGSLLDIPLMGDGRQAVTDSEKATARLFDLNFMRYAKTLPPEWDDDLRKDVSRWAPDVLCSKSMGGPGCDPFINNATNNRIVNIIYRAPSPNMPVFNLVK